MSSFDDRKDAFEKKFAHDEEMKFKLEARTCRLLGMFVAGELGITGAEADAYAREVVSANLEEPGFGDIKRKITADYEARAKSITDHTLDRYIEKFMQEARNQLMESNGR